MAARLTTYVVVGIVAATLIAGLIVGAQRDDNDGPVDLIVHNAAVYTGDADGTIAEAVAIRGNGILRVGGNREILRLKRPQTTTVDAGGGAVLPGFNDAHVHFIDGGLNLDKIDLRGANTLDEIQQRIKSWAGSNPDNTWVVGRGWNEDALQAGSARQVLDALVPDRPAQLVSHDGRASWVNSSALKLAGITRKTASPSGGTIDKDAKTGEPTGILREAAMPLVGRLVPPPTHDERGRALRAAIAEANRNGITSIQNAGATVEDLELFAEARRAGDLRVRVYSALTLGPRFTDDDRGRLLEAARRHPDDPLFKTGAVKIAVDGVMANHTAAMLEPYGDVDASGEPAIAPDDLNRMVRLIDAEGWQVMAHAVGDRAVRLALDAYEHAARSNMLPQRGRRHRVEHVDTIDPADVPRFAALGAIASMQPLAASPQPALIEASSRNLGPDRLTRTWALGSISRARGRLAFGSNWPAADMNPMLGLQTAVTRTTADGLPEGGWQPSQRLALEAAVTAYTAGAAWASFDEQRKGTLAAGMLADLVILSDDIFAEPVTAATLANAQVMFTIFDGKIVYRRDRGSN